MKKIAIVAAIATSAAVAAPFNGFSVGGSLGAKFVKNKVDLTAAGILAGGSNVSVKKTNLMLNVFAGYTKTFGNMFAGADLGLGYEKLAGSNMKSMAVSLAPRLGYRFNETTAVYGKIAVLFNKVNLPNENAIKKSNVSYMPAIGLEKFISSNGSVQAELGYDINKAKVVDTANIKKVTKNGVVASVGYRYSF